MPGMLAGDTADLNRGRDADKGDIFESALDFLGGLKTFDLFVRSTVPDEKTLVARHPSIQIQVWAWCSEVIKC
jgi:hypothetical protein